jgi:ureidoacrylate peracid hydrolase
MKQHNELKIDPKKTAILVIDMQNEFVHEKGKLRCYNAGATIEPTKRLLEAAREVKAHIIYTQVAYRSDYLDAPKHELSRELGATKKGSWGVEIVDELRPKEGDIIIEKQRYSAFYGTILEMILRSLDVDTLILTGCATNVCVESTARDAHARNFDVIVLSDCTAAFDSKEDQEASLRIIRRVFGKVLTSQEVIEALKRGHTQ